MWPRARKREDSKPAAMRRGRRETTAAMLRRLDWAVIRPLASHLGGDHQSLTRGPGMELHELREYQPGDDVRRIDWNITARTDRPYMRESHVERALDVWLAVDLSASNDWGTAECLKSDRAVEFAVVASQLLGRNGNRVGAFLFAERPLGIVPPSRGRAHLLRLLSRISEAPAQATPGRTDLAGALTQLSAVLRRRSLVLLASDFLAPNGWQAALSRLAQRHEVIAIHLHDPREAELPNVGLITLEDPETGQQLVVDTSDHRLRERYRRAAEAQAEQLRNTLASCGVDRLSLSTDTELLPAVARFLNMRRLRQTLRAAQLRQPPTAPHLYGTRN